MRISDWSSDVCSSDLPLRSSRRRGQSAATEAAGGRGHEQISMSASPKLRLFGGFSLSDASGEVAGLTLRKKEALIAFLARSEEHTSELQSLMRISYAVLCLTKHKPTKHNTIHHSHI